MNRRGVCSDAGRVMHGNWLPYHANPKYDLDMASHTVKSYANEHGITYPDMTWEPKQSFWAVADYYAGQR